MAAILWTTFLWRQFCWSLFLGIQLPDSYLLLRAGGNGRNQWDRILPMWRIGRSSLVQVLVEEKRNCILSDTNPSKSSRIIWSATWVKRSIDFDLIFVKVLTDLGEVEDSPATVISIVEVLHFVVPSLDGCVPGIVVPGQVLTHADTETCEWEESTLGYSRQDGFYLLAHVTWECFPPMRAGIAETAERFAIFWWCKALSWFRLNQQMMINKIYLIIKNQYHKCNFPHIQSGSVKTRSNMTCYCIHHWRNRARI